MEVSYEDGSANLSNYMRYTHGIFGARYNCATQRSGKVAQGRPKTPLIQNDEHAIRVHFYIEANPIRAGICKLKALKNYTFSSYGFYAHGIKTKFTHMLTIPHWYWKLGRSSKERQSNYRKLFAKYLDEYSTDFSVLYKQRYIGSDLWIFENNNRVTKSTFKRVSDSVELSSNDSDTG
jgi:putative transposase